MRGDRARSDLSGTRFADLRWVAETTSTNADLLREAAAGAPEGVVLVADHQTAGRGRLGRSWESPPGASLLLSVLLRPALKPSQAHLVASAVGLSAVTACQQVADIELRLKWPNDLLVDLDGVERKAGGILAESIIEHDVLEAVVVGLGLNVNWPETIPEELAGIATALNLVTGREVDREDLLVALLRELDSWCAQLEHEEGRDLLRATYLARSATVGREVRVERPGGTLEGRAVDVTADGHLVVEHETGSAIEITAGDVVHLRHG
ncbi:biotin--[acetyl-CoA-carboxylase] ligase [Rhabdothermincola sediminis]|uniref:biotin--[acetyl-CoA-carboxylase] ligase n=1 Tax=Rhabdothermincola sediminis TaxID=2751370 RepID=UPI001AA00DA1|nr:biotin--[acetyl-CoA-carboxylase] ligase [Rhabdothermincola sediminis]